MPRSMRLCALATLVLFAGSGVAAELATVKSDFTILPQTLQPPTTTPPAFATVVLLAGGDGVLDLDATGMVQQLQGNFLIRSAYRFQRLGLNVAMLDAPGSLNGI